MKRLLEADIDDNEEVCYLDMLVLDIFAYMHNRTFISSTDLVMLAWVYVPVRQIVPERLRGAENLILTLFASGKIRQINFAARTMFNNPYWTDENIWRGFLSNPMNRNRFKRMTNLNVSSFRLVHLWHDYHLAISVLHSAFRDGIDPIMLKELFNYIPHDVIFEYETLEIAIECYHGDSYLEALDYYYDCLNSGKAFPQSIEFPTYVWEKALQRQNYNVLALMLSRENDPLEIHIIEALLSHDDEDAMDVLYEAGLIDQVTDFDIERHIDEDHTCTISKLIDYGRYKPKRADILLFDNHDEDSEDRSSMLSPEMHTILTKAVLNNKDTRSPRSL